MKYPKLPFLVCLSFIVLLGSCKTAEMAPDNTAKLVADKNPLYDEFATKQYYHEGSLISDTVQIKNLLEHSKVFFCDSTNKITIYDSEAKYEASLTNSKAARIAADPNPEHIKLMLFSYVYSTNRQDPKTNFLETMTVKGPIPDYSTYRGITHIVFTLGNHARIENYRLSYLYSSNYRERTSFTKLNVFNPAKYAKRLTLLLNTGKRIVTILNPLKIWNTRTVTIGSPPFPAVPFTGGIPGYIIGHNVENLL